MEPSSESQREQENVYSVNEELIKISQIEELGEKTKALEKLVIEVDELLKAERSDNQKNLKENSDFIKDQCIDIEILKKEIVTSKEQILNNKALLKEKTTELEELKKILKTSGHQACTERIHILKQEIVNLKDFIDTVEQAKVEPKSQGVQTDQNLETQDNNADQNQ